MTARPELTAGGLLYRDRRERRRGHDGRGFVGSDADSGRWLLTSDELLELRGPCLVFLLLFLLDQLLGRFEVLQSDTLS